jgi:hypothetical protein
MPWVTLIEVSAEGDIKASEARSYRMPAVPRSGELLMKADYAEAPMYRVQNVVWKVTVEQTLAEFNPADAPDVIVYVTRV